MVEACSRSVVDGTCAPSLTAPFFGMGWIPWMLLRSGRDASSPSSASCASRPADPEPLIARLPGARKPVAEVIRGRQERPAEQGRAGLVGKVRFVLEDRASRVHHVVRVLPVLRPHARRRREQPCGRGQEEETVAQPFPPGRLANAGASTRGRSLREGGLACVLQLGEYGSTKRDVPPGAAARTSAQPRRRAGTQGRSSLPSTPCEQIAHDRTGKSVCQDSSGRLLALSRKRRLRRAPSATQRLARAYAAPLPLLAPARIEPARRMTICWKLVRPGAGRQHAAAGALVSCPRQA